MIAYTEHLQLWGDKNFQVHNVLCTEGMMKWSNSANTTTDPVGVVSNWWGWDLILIELCFVNKKCCK